MKKKNQKQCEEAAIAVVEDIQDALILSVDSPIESWIMDSGASFHSTSCRECMDNYTFGMFRKVHLADDETLDVVGKVM